MPSDMRSQCPSEETPPSTRPPSAASSSNSSGTPLRSTSMDSLNANGNDKPVGEEYIPTRMIKASPKANVMAMQFVKTGPAHLYKSAKEQMRKAEVVKSLRKTSLLEEEEWQTKSDFDKVKEDDWMTNLDSWKRNRRKRNEDILERVIEVKKNALDDEFSKNRRKGKTFSEMRDDRRGRKCNVVIHDDDNNDLSDLGIQTRKNGKSSPSDNPEEGEGEVKSDAGFCTGSDTGSDGLFPDDNISDTSSAMGDKRESHDSLLESHSSPVHSEAKLEGSTLNDLCEQEDRTMSRTELDVNSCPSENSEYTYDKAIEDYKQFAVNSVKKLSNSSSVSVSSNTNISSTKDENITTLNGSYNQENGPQKRISDRFVDPRIPEKIKTQPRYLRRDKNALSKIDISKRRSMFELRDVGVDTPSEVPESKKLAHRKSIEISETLKNKVASFECLSTPPEDKFKGVKTMVKDTKFKEKLANFSEIEKSSQSGFANRKTTPDSDRNFYRKLKNFNEMAEDRLSRFSQSISESKYSNSKSSILNDRNASLEESSSCSISKFSVSVENLSNSSMSQSSRFQSSQSVLNLCQRRPVELCLEETSGLNGNHGSTSTEYDVRSTVRDSSKSNDVSSSQKNTDSKSNEVISTKIESTAHSNRFEPPQHCLTAKSEFDEISTESSVSTSAFEGYPNSSGTKPALEECSSNSSGTKATIVDRSAKSPVCLVAKSFDQLANAEDLSDVNMNVFNKSDYRSIREYGDEDIDEVIEDSLSSAEESTSNLPNASSQKPAKNSYIGGNSFENDSQDTQTPLAMTPEEPILGAEVRTPVPSFHPQNHSAITEMVETPVAWNGHFIESTNTPPALPPSVPPPPPPIEEEEGEDEKDGLHLTDPVVMGESIHSINLPDSEDSLATDFQEGLDTKQNSLTSSKQDLRKKMSAFLGTTPSYELELQVKPPPDVSEILRQERASERLIVQKQAQDRREPSWTNSNLDLGSEDRSQYNWNERLKQDGPEAVPASLEEDDSGDQFEFHTKLAELELEMEKHDRDMMQRVQKPPSKDPSYPSVQSKDSYPITDHYPSTQNKDSYPAYSCPSTHNTESSYPATNSYPSAINKESSYPAVIQDPSNYPNNHPVPLKAGYSKPNSETISSQIRNTVNQDSKTNPPNLRNQGELGQTNGFPSRNAFANAVKSNSDSILPMSGPRVPDNRSTKELAVSSCPPAVPRKQSIRALSAIPRPRLTDNESWITKRKNEAAANRDYSKHWLIQEAEQRRLEEKEQITRVSDVSGRSRPVVWSSKNLNNNNNIYQNIPLAPQMSNNPSYSPLSSSPSNSSFTPGLKRETSNSSFGSNDSSQNYSYVNNNVNYNNLKMQTKTYQPLQASPAVAGNQGKPLPDAIINTITQRVHNKMNGSRSRPEEERGDYANSEVFTSNQANASPSPPSGGLSPGQIQQSFTSEDQCLLSVSGKKKCSHCSEELGRGAAMIIESLRLFYHIPCFKCCVCGVQLGNGTSGADVRVRNHKLHCHNCYSNDEGMKFSKV